jgi:hypothetical protein
MRKTILGNDYSRKRAIEAIVAAPAGYVATVVEPKRSNAANNLMWSLLTDISRAEPLGRKHTPDDWKALAMNACGWDCQFVEGLDGRPFPIGFRSSQLTKSQMSNLIEWLFAFGAGHGVRWTHEKDEA